MLDRLEILVGDKVNEIKNKTVLVLGIGGVGGYSVEVLARSGIGNIIVVDNDIIDITNLNRQIITNNNNIGKSKVDEAELRIKSINKDCNVIKIKEFITKENIDILFSYNIDYFIDCCDTIETKKEVIRRCTKNNIKLISSMGTANKFDPSKLEIIDIRKTTYDPIAKILRKMVKDEKINKKVMVVCSKECPKKTKGLGSNAYTPAVSGILCASYCINDIVGEL